MGQGRASRQPQQAPHQHDPQQGLAGLAAGQAQVEPTIEQHQAHQQPNDRLEAGAQQLGIDQIEAGPADQQP